MSQKIVIPRGTVNPNETTVVDIPNSLRGSAVVVAKKRNSSQRPGSPNHPSMSGFQSRGSCPAYSKGGSYPQGASQSGQHALSEQMRDLDRIDLVEQNQLTDDLREFQEMRRRLVKDVSNIAGASPTAHKEQPKSVFSPKRVEKLMSRHH